MAKAKLVPVRMLTAMAGAASLHRKGDTVEVERQIAKAWIDRGIAVEAEPTEVLRQKADSLTVANRMLEEENAKLRARLAELEGDPQLIPASVA